MAKIMARLEVKNNMAFLYNHKNVAKFYLGLAVFAGIVAAVFSLLLPLNLVENNLSSITPISHSFFNQFVSFTIISHGALFVFYMAIPALIGGFAHWFVPLMIGSDDVAFPRLNFLAFMLLFLSLPIYFFVIISIATVSLPQLGYFTLVLGVLSFIMIFLSFILNFIIMIVTILTMRASNVPLVKMPIFVWSVLIASFLGLMVVPTINAIIVYISSNAGYGFYRNSSIVSLWLLTHLQLYVILLPAIGIVSQILSSFCQRKLWLENAVIGAMVVIGVVGFALWCNDVFTMPIERATYNFFAAIIPLLFMPLAFITIAWIGTLLKSKIKLEVPVLFSLAFIFTMVLGCALAVEFYIKAYIVEFIKNENYFGRLHYIFSICAVFAILAAWYYWLPKISIYTYRNFSAKLHFWLMFVGVNLVFLPKFLQEYINNNQEHVAFCHSLSIIGVVVIGLSSLVFIYAMVEIYVRRQKNSNNLWGKEAISLE